MTGYRVIVVDTSPVPWSSTDFIESVTGKSWEGGDRYYGAESKWAVDNTPWVLAVALTVVKLETLPNSILLFMSPRSFPRKRTLAALIEDIVYYDIVTLGYIVIIDIRTLPAELKKEWTPGRTIEDDIELFHKLTQDGWEVVEAARSYLELIRTLDSNTPVMIALADQTPQLLVDVINIRSRLNVGEDTEIYSCNPKEKETLIPILTRLLKKTQPIEEIDTIKKALGIDHQ